MPQNNPDKHWTQMTDFRVMIGRCPTNGQYRRPGYHPSNVSYSNFWLTNKDHFIISLVSNAITPQDARKRNEVQTSLLLKAPLHKKVIGNE